MTMDKSSRGWSWLLLTILSSIFFCVTGTSLCVVRHYSGDEFVNEGGATFSCSVYGASCAAGSSLVAGEGRCGCDINEAPRPCPACKCNSIYPVFNGTQCKQSLVIAVIIRVETCNITTMQALDGAALVGA